MYIILSETTTALDAPIRPLHDFILAFFLTTPKIVGVQGAALQCQYEF